MSEMAENRRNTFRSKHCDIREGVLLADGEGYRVRIGDESSGGYRVYSQHPPAFEVGVAGRLLTEDGQDIPVIVKHFSREGMYVRIGLERWSGSASAKDLRHAFSTGGLPRELRTSTILMVVFVGLLLGFVCKTDAVRLRLTQSLSHVRWF